MSQNAIAQEFSADDVHKNLNQEYSQGRLQESLLKLFCQYVPSVYTSHLGGDPAKEERMAKKLLFKPMERFLCGGDPDVTLQQLKDAEKPSQFCGKVFKLGEPTYSCRDCCLDPTCVLCIECFQRSAHKIHRYKMSTSGGGGYCDCGDVEAWKANHSCEMHQAANAPTYTDLINQIPSDMIARAEVLFSFVMQHAICLLSWNEEKELPRCLAQYDDLTSADYNTILYNDEVHTYDQVIKTLERAIKCSRKQAIEYATAIDRDGWSSVSRGAKVKCEEVKTVIEKSPARMSAKPLKVRVVHSSIVKHQIFCQNILLWLQELIGRSTALKHFFCRLSLRRFTQTYEEDGGQLQRETSLVQIMMLADTKLWKASRVASHQLFMTGVLIDPDCKKKFAILFTQMYPRLMKDFIFDDHDHSVCAVSESVQFYTVPTLLYSELSDAFNLDDHHRAVSVTSCSVQIYTVPTLVRMLITEHNLIKVILTTFLKECKSKKHKFTGKFVFDKNDNAAFKRSQYTLYDLKYALTCIPTADEWTPELRTNFIEGYKCLLELLESVQGMDSVTRQTGQHIEFEPEWEQAFNLQLKLADSISVMIEWCATDPDVLKLAFGATLESLKRCNPNEINRFSVEVANHTVSAVKYDVSSQPVSIHVPITRLLSGLYTKCHRLHQIDLQQLLDQYNSDIVLVMEPALRVQVLCAQTQAGMWRRNGFSLLNQIYFYANVRCRTEMFDRDIIMLQSSAITLDANDFLIHLLNKYGLLRWADKDYDQMKTNPQEEIIRQTVCVAEEMLTLLIHVINERYTVGVGQVSEFDHVKREIIHQLCIHPMAHSELTKALPEDPNHETGVEEAVREVADFKKPDGSGKGMYELKPESYQHYTPFFYHYTRTEQSKSEEQQRKRKKAKNENNALPPPYPVPFTPTYAPIIRLLDSDVMIHMMSIVLSRTLEKRSRSFSDAQLERILHLIGLALHEEHRAHHTGNSEYQFIAKATTGTDSIFSKLTSLIGHVNITHDIQKDLLSWLMQYFTEVRALRDSSYAQNAPSLANAGDSKTEDQKRHKANMAAKKRARLMEKMCKMQRDFIKENAALFENATPDLAMDSNEDFVSCSSDSVPAATDMRPVAVGSSQSSSSMATTIKQTCILCQEEHDVTHNDRAMVLAAFVQKSTVLSQNRGHVIENADEYDPLFMPPTLDQGVHTSTCGHVMHADCWQRLYDAMLVKERRQPLRFRQAQSYSIEDKEFLCPLCETLSNTVIPLLPNLNTLIKNKDSEVVELSFNDWLDGIQKTVKGSIQEQQDKQSEDESYLFVPCPLSSITKMMAESVAKNFQLLFEYVYLDSSDHFSDSMMEMLRKYSTDVYSIGLGVHPDDENIRVPIMAWTTCSYTILSIERSLRSESKPLFGALATRQDDCLSALVKFAAVSNQVIQQHVIKKHCVNLFSGLVLTHADHKLQETPGILSMELLHCVVSLCLSMPALYADDSDDSVRTRIPTGSLNDQHALQLALTAHVCQIILTADFTGEQGCTDMEDDGEKDSELLVIYKYIRGLAGLPDTPEPALSQLQAHLRLSCLSFLRSAALFFHYLTGVKGPQMLHEATCSVDEQFELLCSYLSMPTKLSTFFPQKGIIHQLIKSWCIDESVKQKVSSSYAGARVSFTPRINTLVKLPQDYSELINRVSTFTCPRSDSDDSRAPTMCLVCGEMLCSQSYCCQTELGDNRVGAATSHAHSCAAGTALFLRVRECQILLLNSGNRGSFYPPPYLDDYGETDQGLRRGNPLHLSSERYKKLERLWLDHAIPEEIAHSLEATPNLFSIDWQHL